MRRLARRERGVRRGGRNFYAAGLRTEKYGRPALRRGPIEVPSSGRSILPGQEDAARAAAQCFVEAPKPDRHHFGWHWRRRSGKRIPLANSWPSIACDDNPGSKDDPCPARSPDAGLLLIVLIEPSARANDPIRRAPVQTRRCQATSARPESCTEAAWSVAPWRRARQRSPLSG
jgi:hypothetical protein